VRALRIGPGNVQVLSTSSPPVVVEFRRIGRSAFHARETGYLGARRIRRRETTMGVLWVLVLLLIIFAVVGGFAVNNWLFVILLIALILLLVGNA